MDLHAAESDPREERLLFVPTTARDGALTQAYLAEAGIHAVPCENPSALCDQLEDGAAAILLPEETVRPADEARLVRWIREQPPWSDLPVLVLARQGADSSELGRLVQRLGNVTVLERPIRIAALVSGARSALRARRRQYEARAHLSRIEADERRLRELLQAVQDGDRRKDEFLAILAHELRNPLAPIRNSLHILQLRTRNDPPGDRLAEIMERQVNHMVRLVDDLLEVSRITRGKLELRREPVEVAAIIRSAVDTSRPHIESQEHQLTVEIPDEPLTVEGDLVRLTQVFANLLNNAAKYTPPGGRISLTVRREHQEVVVSVRDNGIGIPEPMIPRVFELFGQIRNPASGSQGGLGIGLTLAQRIVEMHEGSLTVLSGGRRKGAEFKVRLPVLGFLPHPSIEASAPARPNARLAARRVLVVDDNHDAADTLSSLLQNLGAEVEVAYNGPDALALLDRFKPAAVVVDLGMPGMDGYEVASRIRARPEWRDLTLIALTGWGQAEDRHRSEQAGFQHHLVKPAEIGALENLLASLEPGMMHH
jgi:signal transduction histidine kinase/ActR/RegA family two-component response regulator